MPVLKLALGDDTRRVAIAEIPSFEQLVQTARDLFRGSAPLADGAASLLFRYTDDEGDLVTVSSSDELREAFASHPKLKLHVHAVDPNGEALDEDEEVLVAARPATAPRPSSPMAVLSTPVTRAVSIADYFAPSNHSAAAAAAATAPDVPPVVERPSVKFVMDELLADGSLVPVGSVQFKGWLVRNDGTKAWPAGTQVVLISGDPDNMMSWEAEPFKLAEPDQQVSITVRLWLPEVPLGDVQYTFGLADADGEPFNGDQFWTQVKIVAEPQYDSQLLKSEPESAAVDSDDEDYHAAIDAAACTYGAASQPSSSHSIEIEYGIDDISDPEDNADYEHSAAAKTLAAAITAAAAQAAATATSVATSAAATVVTAASITSIAAATATAAAATAAAAGATYTVAANIAAANPVDATTSAPLAADQPAADDLPAPHAVASSAPVADACAAFAAVAHPVAADCTAEVVHQNVSCDVCGMMPIVGVRYNCQVCHDYDLCDRCEAQELHDPAHPLTKFKRAGKDCPRFSRLLHHIQSHAAAVTGELHHAASLGCRAVQAVAGKVLPSHAKGHAHGHHHHQGGHGGHHGHHGHHPHHPHHHGHMHSGASAASASSSASARPSRNNQLHCRFVEDVTIPDGSQLAAGSEARKVWRLHNCGDQPWPTDTSIVFVRGDGDVRIAAAAADAYEQVQLPAAAAGEVVDIAIVIRAPSKLGRHYAAYSLADGAGALFGHKFWVEFVVVEADGAAGAAAADQGALGDAYASGSAAAGQDDDRQAASNSNAAASAAAAYSGPFADQMQQLQQMGFADVQVNTMLLQKHGGDVSRAVTALLAGN